MCPEIPLLASGHHRVATRTSVKEKNEYAHVEPRVIKTLERKDQTQEGLSRCFLQLPSNLLAACMCSSAQAELSPGSQASPRRQEQQLDGRCNRLNAGIAALDAEITREEAQTEGWVFSTLFFLSFFRS